ncbi:MAG: hypothetical protein WB767_08495, partial [Nocardioides sp.]
FGQTPLVNGFGGLPLLFDTENPAAAQLDAVLDGLTQALLAHPAVGAVLGLALGGLGGGEIPDVAGLATTLADPEALTDLLTAVSDVEGLEGLDAIPGLADALGVVEMLPLTDVLGTLLGLLGG